MKINFSNGAIIETLNVLNKFNDVRGKLGYAISRTKKCMMDELKPFDEQREKLIEKYGEKTENDGYAIDPESDNYKKFMDEIMPLANEIMISIDIYQVTQEDFDNNESLFDCKEATVKDFDMINALFVNTDKRESKED